MKKNFWKSFITPVAFIAVVVAIIFWSSTMSSKASAEQASTLENAIRKAAISCYAIEGRYPESLQYIKDNYQVLINEDDFIINYEVFASNIMPSVEVRVRDE